MWVFSRVDGYLPPRKKDASRCYSNWVLVSIYFISSRNSLHPCGHALIYLNVPLKAVLVNIPDVYFKFYFSHEKFNQTQILSQETSPIINFWFFFSDTLFFFFVVVICDNGRTSLNPSCCYFLFLLSAYLMLTDWYCWEFFFHMYLWRKLHIKEANPGVM